MRHPLPFERPKPPLSTARVSKWDTPYHSRDQNLPYQQQGWLNETPLTIRETKTFPINSNVSKWDTPYHSRDQNLPYQQQRWVNETPLTIWDTKISSFNSKGELVRQPLPFEIPDPSYSKLKESKWVIPYGLAIQGTNHSPSTVRVSKWDISFKIMP